MSNSMKRRDFLTSLIALAAVAGTTGTMVAAADAGSQKQEHYELRAYRIKTEDKQKIVSTYLEKALLPALTGWYRSRRRFQGMNKPTTFPFMS